MPNIKKIALKVAKEMRDKSEYDVLDLVCNAEPFAEALVAELTKGNEPVYVFRRKGLDDFCTCDKRRFDELSQNPNLFEVRVLYTLPPTASQIEQETAEAWQPIETAPKDQDLLAFNGELGIMKWISGEGYALWAWVD